MIFPTPLPPAEGYTSVKFDNLDLAPALSFLFIWTLWSVRANLSAWAPVKYEETQCVTGAPVVMWAVRGNERSEAAEG